MSNESRNKRGVNPWTIVGWVVVAAIAFGLWSCAGDAFMDGYRAQQERSAADR